MSASGPSGPLVLRSHDQNGHCPNMGLNNKPKLTLTYFNIIKEIR